MRSIVQGAAVMPIDFSIEPTEDEWLVNGLWLRGGINAVLGPEKTGKSRLIGWILTQMLARPAGGPVLWRDDGNGPMLHHTGFKRVLYLNAEETIKKIIPRIARYAAGLGLEARNDWPIDLFPDTAAGFNLHIPRERDAFEERFIKSGTHDVIIIDPLRQVHGADENSNNEMSVTIGASLRRWTSVYGVTAIPVHHTGHLREDADLYRIATWCRGATALPALLDGATCIRTLAAGDDRAVREVRRMGRFETMPDLTLYDYSDPPKGRGFRVAL